MLFKVFSWGCGVEGQLGLTDRVSVPSPSRVPLRQDFIVHVAAGAQHSMAASLDGSLWAWGNGSDGRLGTGRQMITGTPCRVDYFDSCGGFIRCIAAGITHHPLPITHHPSPITHYPSPITHHPSPITRLSGASRRGVFTAQQLWMMGRY